MYVFELMIVFDCNFWWLGLSSNRNYHLHWPPETNLLFFSKNLLAMLATASLRALTALVAWSPRVLTCPFRVSMCPESLSLMVLKCPLARSTRFPACSLALDPRSEIPWMIEQSIYATFHRHTQPDQVLHVKNILSVILIVAVWDWRWGWCT